MRRRLILECCVLALLLPPLLLWLSAQPGLWHANARLYDQLLALNPPPASADILIVGVDERSIHALGRWPWPRTVHAELLRAVAPHAPRAVLLDFFLTEPSLEPAEDGQLARAMELVPTYLPLLALATGASEQGEIRSYQAPLPDLAAAARGMGHVNVTPDADGVVRTLFLHEGPAGQPQPYLGLVMANGAVAAGPASPGVANPWIRQTPLRLPFAGPSGSFRTVPYASVLRGEVPGEWLRGKYLLVGVTDSAGLGDQLLVPNSGPGGTLSGVEIHANALDAIRHGRSIHTLPAWQHGLWIAWAVMLALLLFNWSPHHALAWAAGCLALVMGISVLAITVWQTWLPPAASLLGIVVAYVLWSWRRLLALSTFFRQRVQALNAVSMEPGLRYDVRLDPRLAKGLDFHTEALDHAIARLVQARTREQQAQAQREEWLKFLSHDLRSPQVSILSLLELWRGKAHGMDEEALTIGVQREARRTLELAEGFIDVTTAESGQYQFADCLAGNLVMDAMDQVWPYARARGVQVTHDLPAAESLLHADAHMVTRAIVNLLNNAIRHSATGSSVLVRLEQRPLATNTMMRPTEVVLSVQDHGEGMEMAQLMAVLEPKAHGARQAPHIRGMGVGMAVVRAVVAHHRGWLHATSNPGDGTTFFVGLPTQASEME